MTISLQEGRKILCRVFPGWMESGSRKGALEGFRGTLLPQRSGRKDDCLNAKREFRLCSEARRCRVEKAPARGGITISRSPSRVGIVGTLAGRLVGLVLILVLSTGGPAIAATEIHGADSSFRAEGVTILWVILKGASEETSFVHIRILHDKAAAPGLAFYRVEAVDPFSKERAWVMKGEALGAIQTLKIVRTDFRDKTERWLHFYGDRESLEKGQAALTIFYHGVPDTAPEALTEAELEVYFVQALSRIK